MALHKIIKFLVVLFMLFLCQVALAQNTVVVVPLIGDDGPQYKGAWLEATQYKKSDVVEEGGSSYIAIANHVSDLSNMPSNEDFWGLVAASGANGMNGAPGPAGPKGDTGDTGLQGLVGLTGAKGDTGDAGEQGPKGDTGDTGLQGLVGPPGAKGDTGDVGPAGAVGPSSFDACKDLGGNNGVLLNGVCILSYDNSRSTNWNVATYACAAKGGDLCSASQYSQIRQNAATNNNDIFFTNNPVWSEDFSDNDGGAKTVFLSSSDDPLVTLNYSYGCCGTLQPEPYASVAQTIQGLRVTWLQTTLDTTFAAAASICSALSSDLCSKSQYAALQSGGVTGDAFWTREMSDNDAGNFDGVVGSSVADNPSTSSKYGFACCASSRPLDYSCPNGNVLATTGICITATNASEDASFFTAAQACAAQNSDICSKSQTTVIRSVTPSLQAVRLWTNDGADNDSVRAGGLLNTQPNNPDPNTDQMGYVCCR